MNGPVPWLATLLALASSPAEANVPLDGWRDGVVPFHFYVPADEDDPWQAADQAVVRQAIARIERVSSYVFDEQDAECDPSRGRYACLEVFDTGDDPYGNPIRINVGNRGRGVTTHELIHGLGFLHEHQRSDTERDLDFFGMCSPKGNVAPSDDAQRALLGPREFGGWMGPTNSLPTWTPFVPTSPSDESPTSIMAYSGHKGQSPFQACFFQCFTFSESGVCVDGRDVREPWTHTPDDSWRDWPCDGGWGQGGLPADIRGCNDKGFEEAYATCLQCKAESSDGRLHLTWERPTGASDETIGIAEQRSSITYQDRAKLGRSLMDLDLDDVLQLGPSTARRVALREEGTSIASTATSETVGARGEIVVAAYLNGDLHTDLLHVSPSTGEAEAWFTREDGSFRTQALPALPIGHDVVVPGWFEDDDGSGQHVPDANQDLFVYDPDTGSAEIGHYELSGSGLWSWVSICSNEIGTGWRTPVAGTFEVHSWRSQVVMTRADEVAIFAQDDAGCLAVVRSFPAPSNSGSWTHVIGLQSAIWTTSCDDCLDGDRYTDLLFYDGSGQSGVFLDNALLWRADLDALDGAVLGFEPVAPGPFLGGADWVFAADLDDDRFAEVVLVDDDGALTVMSRTEPDAPFTGVGQMQLDPEALDWVGLGQLPDGSRPTTATCGNELQEQGEVCDGSDVDAGCGPGQVGVCGLLCQQSACADRPIAEPPRTGCATNPSPAPLGVLPGLLLLRFRRRR
ncbi:MAG: hypothetical protein KTR31_11580 [Myxococcales bacterium]|nr:hypothetical protein [Myxococcales bacterium]